MNGISRTRAKTWTRSRSCGSAHKFELIATFRDKPRGIKPSFPCTYYHSWYSLLMYTCYIILCYY